MRWATCLFTLLLAVWLIVSPWVSGDGGMPRLRTDVAIGVVVLGLALWSVRRPENSMPAVAMLVFGLLTMAAPWLLGYSDAVLATINDLWVGLLVVMLGIARLPTDSASAYG